MRVGRADLGKAQDAALVIAAQARDEMAFAELARRRQVWLRSLLRRLCGDPAEADDLAQDTLLRAWDRIGDLRQPHAFNAWLRRLAVMRFLQARRRARFDIDLGAESDTLAADTPGPDRTASARIDADRALAVLSPAERLCLTLNLGEGLSHDEIEKLTRLPLGTIKSHITRGRTKLRAVLGDPHG